MIVKIVVSLLFAMAPALLVASANDSVALKNADSEAAAKGISEQYFKALTSGDVDKADAISVAPFSLDRKAVLNTMAEVKKMHRKILQNKGKRKIPAYAVSKTNKAPKLDPKVFPEYFVFRVTIAEAKEFVDIYVSKSKNPKVIGFSD